VPNEKFDTVFSLPESGVFPFVFFEREVMKVKACIYTDAGKKRKINQDSVLLKVANSEKLGRISFVAVCDGMGGLAKGEIASCKAIRSLENWFHEELSLMQDLEYDRMWDVIEVSWRRLIARIGGEFRRYARHRKINLGTTITAFLQIGERYMIMNLGDSRIYIVSKGEVRKLTKDHSVLQKKIDEGVITEKEALCDEEKSVLFKCLGSMNIPEPDITRGNLDNDSTIIACSDGFWRTMDNSELYRMLCPQMCVTSEDMLDSCKKLVKRAYEKNETDNISVAALCMEH